MREKELIIFIILMTLLIIILLAGIFIFLFQYRKRKLLFEKEKLMTEKQHQLDLLNTRLDSQQQTMQLIGREIHDNVGQKLTLASLYCRQTNQDENVETINLLIDDSLKELRRLSKSLTDPDHTDKTFTELLQAEADLINHSGACSVALHFVEDFPPLIATTQHILISMLKEFIQNSLKHAACTLIRIDLLTEGGQICILAIDNGKGFDPAKVEAGVGLASIQKRAMELKAEMKLTSVPGEGTSLFIKLPVP